MGNETEFDSRNGRKWETIRDEKHHFFTKKREKNRKKLKKTGEKTQKTEKKGKKTENYKKLILGKTENGNDILTIFREMLKTETISKTIYSQMSRNDDSRANPIHRH